MVRYLTRDGDMLDALCMAHYGRTAGVVEAVLAANPGLADRGPVLAAGVVVLLPELPAPGPKQGLSLWD